jgi:hypothetical protein
MRRRLTGYLMRVMVLLLASRSCIDCLMSAAAVQEVSGILASGAARSRS